MIYIHLPTGQRGHIRWEAKKEYGLFHATSGVEFTVHKSEVVSLKELKEAATSS